MEDQEEEKAAGKAGCMIRKITNIRNALCSILTTSFIILTDFEGTLSHVLRDSVAWSRKPLEGREARYRYGWRTT